MKKPKTICAECKYVINECWSNWYCGHPENEKTIEIDPVSGEQGYASTNELGHLYISDTKYHNCRDLNKGYCSIFEKANS